MPAICEHGHQDHPTSEQLAAWIDGGLPGEENEVVMEHLVDCYECYVTVRRVFDQRLVESDSQQPGSGAS